MFQGFRNTGVQEYQMSGKHIIMSSPCKGDSHESDNNMQVSDVK